MSEKTEVYVRFVKQIPIQKDHAFGADHEFKELGIHRIRFVPRKGDWCIVEGDESEVVIVTWEIDRVWEKGRDTEYQATVILKG